MSRVSTNLTGNGDGVNSIFVFVHSLFTAYNVGNSNVSPLFNPREIFFSLSTINLVSSPYVKKLWSEFVEDSDLICDLYYEVSNRP